MRLFHEPGEVRPHPFPHKQVIFQDLIDLLRIAPHFIWRPGQAGRPARGPYLRLDRPAVSMQPHDRAEGSVFKPAHQEFMELRIPYVRPEKAADIRRPPRDSRDPHIESRGELVPEALKGGHDITGPDQSAIALASCPRAAEQVDDILLSFPLHAVEERLRVHDRVYITHLDIRSEEVAVIVIIIISILRLRFIQPEDFHSLAVIIPLRLTPDILPRLRIGRVKVKGIALEIHGNRISSVCADQEASFLHLGKILASVVDRRPDRDHQLDPHFLQFGDHGIRIRPVDRIEFPLSLQRPMEEIHHNDGDREISFFILPGNFQELFLCLVTQLALPEAHRVIRHHRNRPRNRSIRLLNLGRSVSCRDPVIQLLRRFRFPRRDIPAEIHAPDRRIVPQKTVSQRRDHKGDAGL